MRDASWQPSHVNSFPSHRLVAYAWSTLDFRHNSCYAGVTGGHASAARMQQRAMARLSAEVLSADRRRRVMLTAPPQHSSIWADEMMPWALMPSSRSFSSSRHRDRRLEENGTVSPTSTELQYSMPLLEEAKLLHPGLQVQYRVKERLDFMGNRY